MKICLLNTYDQEGGAARACRRLYHGLSQQADDVSFLVRERKGDDASILTLGCSMLGSLGALLDERMLHQYRQRQLHNFSSAKRLAPAIRKATGAPPLVTSTVRPVTAKMPPPTMPPIPIDRVEKVPSLSLSPDDTSGVLQRYGFRQCRLCYNTMPVQRLKR